MSSTWRDFPDRSQTRVVLRRPGRRLSAHGASLALPAVVMCVLGGAFVTWFMNGGHLPGSAIGQANALSSIRPAVQTPQMAAAPSLVEPRSADPAPPQPIDALIAAMAAAPIAAPPAPEPDMTPLAFQPTRQITTPAPMTAVVGEPEQISTQRINPTIQPERRPATLMPAVPAAQTAQATQAPPAAPKIGAEAPAAEAERPTRGNFAAVLASVETESEARAKLGQFKQKFSSLLGARRLNYHRTKQDGVYVWHVRSAGLSEADAEDLCEKIEKAGGECSAVDQ